MNVYNEKMYDYLLSKGFFLEKKEKAIEIYFNNEIRITIVDQRFDGIEVYLEKGANQVVGIGFFLEYYLTKDVAIVKKNREGADKKETFHKVYIPLLEAYLLTICDKSKFNFNDYNKWIRNKTETQKALELILKKN